MSIRGAIVAVLGLVLSAQAYAVVPFPGQERYYQTAEDINVAEAKGSFEGYTKIGVALGVKYNLVPVNKMVVKVSKAIPEIARVIDLVVVDKKQDPGCGQTIIKAIPADSLKNGKHAKLIVTLTDYATMYCESGAADAPKLEMMVMDQWSVEIKEFENSSTENADPVGVLRAYMTPEQRFYPEMTQ